MKYYDEITVNNYSNGYLRDLSFSDYIEIPNSHKLGDLTKLNKIIDSRFCNNCINNNCENCPIIIVKKIIDNKDIEITRKNNYKPVN